MLFWCGVYNENDNIVNEDRDTERESRIDIRGENK